MICILSAIHPGMSILIGFMLVAAVLLAFYRLVRGPTLSDRVVALDLLSMLGVGIAGAYAITEDQPVYLDVAIIFALVTFLAAIAFARYIERRSMPSRGRTHA